MRFAVLAALLVTAGVPASATAQPGPPSEAPPAAKQVCARYRVAQTANGPAARCVAHRNDVLGSGTAGSTTPPAAPEMTPPPPPSGTGEQADRAGGTSPATSRSAPPAKEGGRSSPPAPDPGSGGDAGGTPAAILAGCAALAAILLAVAARPLFRRAGLRA
jgi:hypothetical protein